MQQHGNIRGAGEVPDGEQGEQHQHRTGKRVEEEFERRVDPPRPAPDADDEIHRDQHPFEEHIENNEVERAECAHHHGLEDKEGEHVFTHVFLYRLPACQHADRRQRGGKQHKQHADAIDPHAIAHAELRQPCEVLDKLEAGLGSIEFAPEQQAEREDDQAGPKRRPAGVGGNRRLIAAHREDDGAAEQRQPGNQREQRETSLVHHFTGKSGKW